MVFDPRVLYDVRAERWILAALAWNKRTHDPPPEQSTLLLSVSASADPTGLWWSWALDAGTTAGTFADYPALAVDDRAVCVAWNVHKQPLPARVRVFPKAALYAGGKIPFRDFVDLKIPGGKISCTHRPAPGPTRAVSDRPDRLDQPGISTSR